MTAPVPVSPYSYLYVRCSGNELHLANCPVLQYYSSDSVRDIQQKYVLCGKGNVLIQFQAETLQNETNKKNTQKAVYDICANANNKMDIFYG